MAANLLCVDGHERLLARVAVEQDDVLCLITLAGHDPELGERLWSELVDLLVESAFLEVRRALLAGEVDREGYVAELTALADQCRASGLLPLSNR